MKFKIKTSTTKWVYDHKLIKLQWFGLKGNEKADHLAKQSITKGTNVKIRPDYTELLTKFNRFSFLMRKSISSNCKTRGSIEDL